MKTLHCLILGGTVVIITCTGWLVSHTIQAHKAQWLLSANSISGATTSTSPAAVASDSLATSPAADGKRLSEYLNNKYGFSFFYPESMDIDTADSWSLPGPYTPGSPDDGDSLLISGETDGGISLTVNDPTTSKAWKDTYGDSPSFWQGNLVDVTNKVASLLGNGGRATVEAPIEKELGGEPAYWILVKATSPDPYLGASGAPSAIIGWNGYGGAYPGDTFLVVTSHNNITYQIIVPNREPFLQIVNSWQFASSSGQ